ncbi:MAG: DUF58 domain-containing protein [Proteobacteria bacterium]|nr:DUF58 domain-containing protein [Pseudomonadota bacterium]
MLPQEFTPEFFRRLELLKLRSRRSYLGTRQGGHLSLKRGHGIEFSDYRQYEPGDNPRHIDWGLFARSDRLYVKRFQEEQNLTVLLLVDGSASMMNPPEDQKWVRARDIALALSYVALMEQDAVTLSVPGHLHSPLYSGAQAFHQIARELSTSPGAAQFDFSRESQRAVSRVRFPGIAVFISDFLMPLDQIEAVTNAMRAKALDITAVQVLGPHDLEPFPANTNVIAVDSESGEEVPVSMHPQALLDYREYLEQHIRSVRQLFFDARIGFCQTKTTDDLSQFVVQSLARTGLLQ